MGDERPGERRTQSSAPNLCFARPTLPTGGRSAAFCLYFAAFTGSGTASNVENSTL
jgi:hypothetical protein